MRLPLYRPLAAFAAAVVCALAVRVEPVLAQPAAAGTMTLTPTKVTEHGWFFQGEAGMASAANRGFMSNAGFVVTGDGVVVFDALGTPVLGEAMVAAIRKVTRQPIRRVIVSHYHADHVYGLQPLKRAGAEIWAHRLGEQYFTSGVADERLAQRRRDLFPWVDEKTAVVKPDLWIDGDTDFRLGGLTFRILFAQGAHSPEDVMLYVVEDRLLFAGDLLFAGRVPFVGNADSKGWLVAMDKMIAVKPAVVVPGHGAVSRDVERDLVLTRDYLAFLRDAMGKAVAELETFDEAYAKVDWSRFKGLPAFEQANRINAYGTYLRMEQEALSGGRK
ncbi:MAG TPA: MBL fold metallo-hydrolase [Casimicrobiaceae bacterium]|nr:MBL fold metallo-hydrolase [Casimicrobiaceae bacterium]